MEITIQTIRDAVCRHHGGFDQATDGQVLTLWHSLDAATQTRYCDEVKGKSPKCKIAEAADGGSKTIVNRQ